MTRQTQLRLQALASRVASQQKNAGEKEVRKSRRVRIGAGSSSRVDIAEVYREKDELTKLLLRSNQDRFEEVRRAEQELRKIEQEKYEQLLKIQQEREEEKRAKEMAMVSLTAEKEHHRLREGHLVENLQRLEAIVAYHEGLLTSRELMECVEQSIRALLPAAKRQNTARYDLWQVHFTGELRDKVGQCVPEGMKLGHCASKLYEKLSVRVHAPVRTSLNKFIVPYTAGLPEWGACILRALAKDRFGSAVEVAESLE